MDEKRNQPKTKAATTRVDISDYDAVGRLRSNEEQVTELYFKETKDVSFEAINTGEMVVRVKGRILPPFDGQMFHSDFIGYVNEHLISSAADYAYDEVLKAVQRYYFIQAMLEASRS